MLNSKSNMHEVLHQNIALCRHHMCISPKFTLTAVAGKIWGLLGVAECEEGGEEDEIGSIKKE